MDQFISENELLWIPYDKFQNIEYLDKGGFGTIYKAECNSYEVILKSFNCLNNSDESLNKFLNEQKIIDSKGIIKIYGFTKNSDASNYKLIMEYTNKGNIRGCLADITKNWKQRLLNLYQVIDGLNNIHKKDLMKKCWSEDPSKRPSSEEVLNIIASWVFYSEKVNYELKSNIMEFINAPIKHNNLIVKSHPKVCYTSHLLDFTSKELNEILEDSQELKTGLENIQKELVDLQQMNFQLEKDNQILKLNLAVQIKEFAEKENILQDQIINLLNDKQILAGNLTKQLEQNKLTNQQVQIQISQLEQKKIDLEEKLTQAEANIQELKFKQENLIEQKEKLENRLNQFQINYEQIKQERINKVKSLSQNQKLTSKLKAKLEKEYAQLKQKLINEE
ncbi:unnamed protein product [Rhizophagus irregularis]|nr:unnamed protein product [Rhizophagus irregularis]